MQTQLVPNWRARVPDPPSSLSAPTSAFFPGWICPLSVRQKKAVCPGGAAGSWQVHWKEYAELVGFITMKVLGTQSEKDYEGGFGRSIIPSCSRCQAPPVLDDIQLLGTGG